MSTYKEIKGFKVQTLASDTVASQVDTGAWASAASMNTARISSTGTGSASTNYIIAGGYYLPPTVDRSVTEQYNGTAWTEVADCPQDLTYGNGLGSGTSSLLCSYSQPGPAPGGYGPTTATHKWDGSSWSTVNSMNTFRQNAGTAGSTTAGLVFGGSAPSANANTESWDGTNWTEVNDMNTAKTDIGGGCGVQTAALSASGSPATTEQWDGSSWTEVTEINTARQNSGKAGLYTSALCISGQNPSTYVANVEVWNGSSWTEVSDVSTARGYVGGMSPTGSAGSSDAIIAGGSGASLSAATEVWTTSSSFTKINLGQVYYNSTSNAYKVTEQAVPTGSWASGGSLNTGRNGGGSAGTTQNTGLAFGGSGPSALTESYNGTSWTEVNDLNTARNEGSRGMGGTQTSALMVGGAPSPTFTESWNGTSWTEITDINTGRKASMIAATSNTSAMIMGGEPPPTFSVDTEVWNGTAWTEVNNLNKGRNNGAGTGTVTASIAIGGQIQPPNAAGQEVESWNGTSWTEIAEVNTATRGQGISGTTNTDTLIFGTNPGASAKTEYWNGSSWTELADLATGRGGIYGFGSVYGAGAAGGTPPATIASTEEWNAATLNKTITVS
jgi:hypothetical protein